MNGDTTALLERSLGRPLADRGFAPHDPSEEQSFDGLAYLRIGANGDNRMILGFAPQNDGAEVRMFLWSHYGDWVPQDLQRWGIPRRLRRGTKGWLGIIELMKALDCILDQLDILRNA